MLSLFVVLFDSKSGYDSVVRMMCGVFLMNCNIWLFVVVVV